LSRAGNSVLIIEAGPGGDRTLAAYERYLSRFYGTAFKDNQSPYPPNPNAPMPRSTRSDAGPWYGDPAPARRFVAPFGDHVAAAGLASISEISDGDAPFTPRRLHRPGVERR
jgi:hypothetical protein